MEGGTYLLPGSSVATVPVTYLRTEEQHKTSAVEAKRLTLSGRQSQGGAASVCSLAAAKVTVVCSALVCATLQRLAHSRTSLLSALRHTVARSTTLSTLRRSRDLNGRRVHCSCVCPAVSSTRQVLPFWNCVLLVKKLSGLPCFTIRSKSEKDFIPSSVLD